MLSHFFTAIYAGFDKFRIQQQFGRNVKSSNVKKKCNLFLSLKKLDDKGNVLFEGWLACQVCLGAICRKTTFEINVCTKWESTCTHNSFYLWGQCCWLWASCWVCKLHLQYSHAQDAPHPGQGDDIFMVGLVTKFHLCQLWTELEENDAPSDVDCSSTNHHTVKLLGCRICPAAHHHCHHRNPLSNHLALVLTRLTLPAFWMERGKTRFWIPTSVTSAEPVMSRCCTTGQCWPMMERVWLSQTPCRTTCLEICSVSMVCNAACTSLSAQSMNYCFITIEIP